MTQHESPESILESKRSATIETPSPEPEPWTPERVSEWNSYYDLYIVLGVLLLCFMVSANKITNSSLWTRLKVGQIIAEQKAPLLKDSFSFTKPGASWVNVPWLFDLSHAALYDTAFGLSPKVPGEEGATKARAEQVAAGTLVAINALARMLTALLLLRVCRAGPGRWWSAICVTIALGAVIGPGAVLMGGIAKPGLVSPETWGLLLLALEVLLLHRVIDLGKRGAAFALVPLFMIWANIDDSFLIGLILLAAVVVGRVKAKPPVALGFPAAAGVLAASALACLANPSFFAVYAAAADPFVGLFRPATDVLTPDQLSYFGKSMRDRTQQLWPLVLLYHVGIMALGLGSFYLNKRRFSLSRFLMYCAASVLWAVLMKYSSEFSIVFAATMALNGQEWYQDKFGVLGRTGTSWSVWSVGGRAVTIMVLFLCLCKVLLGGLPVSGLTVSDVDAQFGFGFDRDDFSFEAANFLKTAPIEGNVLNTTKAEGDALIWQAYPARKVYIDNRRNLYPPEVFNRLQETRKALADDKVEAWKPLLDRYNISAVMISEVQAPRTYQTLSQSKNWVPFYDDGDVVMFGRADAPAADLAFFEDHRLNPERKAYVKADSPPPTERPPSPVTWMDHIFDIKRRERPQHHNEAARHWLMVPPATPDAVPLPPDPARCLLAVRAARTALASKPDDTQAFRYLAVAYRQLMVQESALMAGMKLGPETAVEIGRLNPRPNLIPTRFRQLITALNYAIQTTPPPRTFEARRELQGLNVELFQILMAVNSYDLARDRLQAVLDKSAPSDFKPEERAQLAGDLLQLNEKVKQVEEQMTTAQTEQQLGPVELANLALNQGAPGLAIHELEEAERTGTNPALVKPRLLDLYCDTGQPDKGIEMLSSGTIDDPTFGVEAGSSAMRQGRVYFLLGNNEYGGTLFEKYALKRVRQDRSFKALDAARAYLKGEVRGATGALLEIPARIREQAEWEFEAGLCRLEGGSPALAADHFTSALTLNPKINTRPIMAYYLEKLGAPVPPLPDESADDSKKPADDKPSAGEKPARRPPTPSPQTTTAKPGAARPEASDEPAPK